MNLRVKVKLKLSRQNKRICIKYNTFEKATFDQYLLTSLAKHTPSEEAAMQYIDEITGNGSLNSHFKKMYSDIVELTDEQQANILQSSQYPVFKIDESNRYVYYPELNISIYKDRVYTGDIEELDRESILHFVHMQEEIIDLRVDMSSENNKAEPYDVIIENGEQISISIKNKKLSIDSALFAELLVLDLTSIKKYEGKIHTVVDGDRWSLLTNAAINNLYSNAQYFYDENGDHLQIRNDNIRKTEIAQISGLYIYRESIVNYEKDIVLSSKVLEIVQEKLLFSKFHTNFYLKIFQNIATKKAIEFINFYYVENKLPQEIARYVLELVKGGTLTGWHIAILQQTLKYAKQEEYELLYRADSSIKFDIHQLLSINKTLLTAQDKERVDAYNKDLYAKQESIQYIIGKITVKGLREGAKKLKADDKTKKFSKLCNKYIGHVNKDLQNTNLEETEKILKEVQELQQLGIEIERKLLELASKKAE